MADRLNLIRARIVEARQSADSESLDEYAELFPGEDVLVARAYADVFGGDGAASASSNQDSVGHYRILKELGRGGQGIVYLAEDTRLHRKVALKVLTGLGSGSEDSVHRFRREAEVASKLKHPGICGVHDAGVANGTPYIAMHYVEGTTLADRISGTKTRMPTDATTTKNEIPELLRVFEKTAQALHAAHEAGIIHRDIKPGNIMVTAAGQPVILDFGLARAEDLEFQTLTRTGDVFGTPAYMSPEQIAGQRIRLDRRSDIYSLGVSLYECVTLARPFEAATREGLYRDVMTKSPPDPRKFNPAIPRELKVVIETALEKDRDRRYATADAMAKDIRAVLEGRPIQARRVGPVGRFVRWSKREPAKAALLGVLLVALPVIAALVTSHVKDRPEVEAARLAKVGQEKDEILSEASSGFSEGDPNKAVALYSKVLEMEGTSPEAAGGLVLAHLRLNDARIALGLVERYRELLGDGMASHLLSADALWLLGRNEEARSLRRTAPAPRSAFEHHLLAEKELQKGEKGDHPAFDRSLHHATTAILLSQAPRFSLYMLRVHAAGHAMNRDAVLETTSALRQRWAGSASALVSCAEAMSNLNDPTLIDEAIATAREAVRLKPGLVEAHGALGRALEAKGLIDGAIASFREAIRLSPRFARAHRHLGLVLAAKGSLDDAIAACREAVRLAPKGVAAHRDLGRFLVAQGKIDDGIAELREAIRLKPEEVGSYQYLADAFVKKGLLDEAIAACREAVRLSPDEAILHMNLGLELSKRGLLDDAISSLREAIRLSPDFGHLRARLGAMLIQKGLLDEGMAALREGIRLEPEYAPAHMNLGIALAMKGRFDDAIAAYRESIRLKPNDAQAQVYLGRALLKQDLLDEAIATYREAIRLKPDDVESHFSLGQALMGTGFLDDAAAAYREAIRLDPDVADPHCNLAQCLRELGRFREALAENRLCHEIGSRRAGWSYPSEKWVADGEHLVEGEEDLEAQLDGHVSAGTQPEDAGELVALARVVMNQGRSSLAARWYQAAFSESPDVADAIVAGHRRLAARAAVLNSIGGTDSAPALDDAARATWRTQALAWLEADVAGIKKALDAERLTARRVRLALVPLTRSPDLASVRTTDALARLPEGERLRWSKLWVDIEELLAALERKPESR